MFAGVAVLVVALGAAGAYFATKGNAEGTPLSRPLAQGDTGASAAPSAPVAAPLSVERELESADALVDPERPEQAPEALRRLAALETAARAADDSTFLRFRFVRGRALMLTNERAGCDSLADIEGRLRASRLAAAAGTLLTYCRQP
jgi:hypothetical protein